MQAQKHHAEWRLVGVTYERTTPLWNWPVTDSLQWKKVCLLGSHISHCLYGTALIIFRLFWMQTKNNDLCRRSITRSLCTQCFCKFVHRPVTRLILWWCIRRTKCNHSALLAKHHAQRMDLQMNCQMQSFGIIGKAWHHAPRMDLRMKTDLSNQTERTT